MNHARLEDMVKGWFVGAFTPTAHATGACEVAFKSYRAGDKEELHHHKVATEITVVLSGKVRMAGREWSAGDIIVLEPGEATDFEAITHATNIVVKTPGAINDKYLGVPA
jgi:quercetin dioxygenase-like cupin family protein